MRRVATAIANSETVDSRGMSGVRKRPEARDVSLCMHAQYLNGNGTSASSYRIPAALVAKRANFVAIALQHLIPIFACSSAIRTPSAGRGDAEFFFLIIPAIEGKRPSPTRRCGAHVVISVMEDHFV